MLYSDVLNICLQYVAKIKANVAKHLYTMTLYLKKHILHNVIYYLI